MFEYLEPDANNNPEAGSLPLPPSGNSKGTRPLTPEKVRHMLYGIDRTIKILHTLGYADPNDWSDPIPVPPSGAASAEFPEAKAIAPPTQWMVIMTKTVLLE
ncbi:hypothetical protein VB780_13805 [Leptolyngbya sp. CCNP1308]|uniref:hypothetical protein n=1 Tax=Leptolyngbya sp. CCNP1308 TaxID=3110255 RepID=UPI002B1F5CA6|nr:hypothetical protein [Leptolyngbya sp. CCNP1308]MEA5449655.1 hypothetical protein [Leptolyngbya sp. CCNP1308]